ncbi:hypothetical protein GCM10018785_62120 [Streptomyces longispororuber]|uniref:Integral membrane protein n=1 Tax=Streptomyces longispororuber TaxID=68230 RepID=A0A919DWJ3_9ACTN|nr:hypothetical protein [Streptomyces longispororuber]GHE85949.1 hypothetical protein GCM10018785_62120 [Streptomyces longispororuber]
MHGHGYAPPPPPAPSAGSQVTLRVLFVVLAFLTCGFLAWAAMLRLALVTRKARDWFLFVVVVALDVTAAVLIGIDPGDEEFTGTGNAGMTILIASFVAVTAYYLTMEIRHFAKLAEAGARDPYRQQYTAYPAPQPHPTAYGYPQQTLPAPAPQPPASPGPPAPGPHQAPAAPHTPTHTPTPGVPTPPVRPAPVRIEQVRAELDELSDYLRRQEGGGRP